ncbi:MAG TPA: hypothetical protein VNW06_06440 [Cytophagaceae bacterium]|nr:hypothetical protein [Cytophagaceae bacterium]
MFLSPASIALCQSYNDAVINEMNNATNYASQQVDQTINKAEQYVADKAIPTAIEYGTKAVTGSEMAGSVVGGVFTPTSTAPPAQDEVPYTPPTNTPAPLEENSTE